MQPKQCIYPISAAITHKIVSTLIFCVFPILYYNSNNSHFIDIPPDYNILLVNYYMNYNILGMSIYLFLNNSFFVSILLILYLFVIITLFIVYFL